MSCKHASMPWSIRSSTDNHSQHVKTFQNYFLPIDACPDACVKTVIDVQMEDITTLPTWVYVKAPLALEASLVLSLGRPQREKTQSVRQQDPQGSSAQHCLLFRS